MRRFLPFLPLLFACGDPATNPEDAAMSEDASEAAIDEDSGAAEDAGIDSGTKKDSSVVDTGVIVDTGVLDSGVPDWTKVSSNTTQDLWGVWGAGANDVYAVGYKDVTHFDGQSWTASTLSNLYLNDVTGLGANDVWIAADSYYFHKTTGSWMSTSAGQDIRDLWAFSSTDAIALAGGSCSSVRRFDGSQWNYVSTYISFAIGGCTALWASATNDIWMVGGVANGKYYSYRFDGQKWNEYAAPGQLWDVSGASSDVWVVGDGGLAAHWSNGWSVVKTNVNVTLSGVWVRSASDIWMVGNGGTALHWNGQSITPSVTGTTENLHAVWMGPGAQDVWAVGSKGTILRLK